MSYSYTITDTATFTRTHARHIAAKVVTDLKRMQRFYGEPSDNWIAAFEAETVEFLKGGLLDKVSYGFRRNGDWIEPTLIYTSRDLMGIAANDDDPGRVRPNAQISGASFHSYLTYNSKWNQLTREQREDFAKMAPLPKNCGSRTRRQRILEPKT